MTVLHLELPGASYDISIGRGLIDKAGELFNLKRRVVIVTDEGVPEEYAKKIEAAASEAITVRFPMGEGTKSFFYFEKLLSEMLTFKLTRSDCIVAVGGGVVGDLTGFAAACYMRGIDFYNVPTTLLSMVDSSIGGKTAINLGVTKNTVGAFHQPKGVLIDPNCLKTLPKRHISAGLAEALKMAMTSDEKLFEIFEKNEITPDITEEIIIRSLCIKKSVVEKDERETGLRKILNFGHSFGHGIEAECYGRLYHGECVALGLIPMTDENLRPRLTGILKKLGLPTEIPCDTDAALSHVLHDKKCKGNKISAVFVKAPGSFEIKEIGTDEFREHVKANLK